MDTTTLQSLTQNWLKQHAISGLWATPVSIIINIAVLLLICIIVDFVIHKVISTVVRSFINKSKNLNYKDVFTKEKPFSSLSHIAPGLLVYFLVPLFFNASHVVVDLVRTAAVIYIIVLLMVVAKRY